MKGKAIARIVLFSMIALVLLCVLLAGLGLDKAALERLVAPLSPEELEQVEKAWEQKAAERYPLCPQLRYEEREQKETGRDGAFLI